MRGAPRRDRASSLRFSTPSRSRIRIIHTRVRAAGLAGLLGYTGETNIQGEEVQKLDSFANESCCTVLERSGRCAMVASEEIERAAGAVARPGKYVVCFDPLDGSSNIDVNISIGTIFCVLRAQTAGRTPAGGARSSPGAAIVAAGYAVYGSVDHALPVDRATACTGSRSTPASASSSSRTRTSGVPTAGAPTRSTRETSRAGRSREEVGRVAQERRTRRRGCRTGIATSARSSPTRTGRCSRAASSPIRRTRRAPRASSACSTRRTRWPLSSSKPGGAATNGVDRILDIEPKRALHDRTPLGARFEPQDVGVYREFMTCYFASERLAQSLHAGRLRRPDVLVHLELHADRQRVFEDPGDEILRGEPAEDVLARRFEVRSASRARGWSRASTRSRRGPPGRT